MTIKLKTMTMKNFLSVGNVQQTINFERNDLTLVFGTNHDLGGDEAGARNGCGKSAAIFGLSYALYGQAISNIKLNNLINRTNEKNMLVTIEFEINNRSYRIERGRKPNILRFFVNGVDKAQSDDSAQGENKETQAEIEEILGMSHDMFKNVLALTTYTEPFLAMKAADQRSIIEQLLGVTQLSVKAESLKEQIKYSKDLILKEEYRIKAIQETNRRIGEQIEGLRSRQTQWALKKENDINDLAIALESMNSINIEEELANHQKLADHNSMVKLHNDTTRWIRQCQSGMLKEEKIQNTLNAEIASLSKHKCYACGSDIHDSKMETILTQKQAELSESAMQWLAHDTQLSEHQEIISQIGEIGNPPTVFYKSMDDAMSHRSTMEKLTHQLETRMSDTDPYEDQIVDMTSTAIEEVSWDMMNSLTSLKEHQEFLLKLLTNKDSFIRKTIIEQNLAYLNSRLRYYLKQFGLPHTVKFQSDLTVLIEELGRDLDFHNLSRGEMTRLSLSLSMAFRDVYEGLFQPINLIFIDELLDSGMDPSGLEKIVSVLKKTVRDRNKSIWVISHREELRSQVNSVMNVHKINGFTTYEMTE